MSKISNGGGLVVISFLSTECPICQNYTLTLNLLQKKYENKIQIIGVFPNQIDSIPACTSFQKKYKTNFPLFKDTNQKLVGALKAVITPEVYLWDPVRNVIIYHGAIDNWFASLGKNRNHPTINYLENAIKYYYGDKSVVALPDEYAEPVGCYIMN